MLIVLFWRSARGSLCEQPHRHLLREHARRTSDLFESVATSPTEIYCSEQQIQSKACTENTCERQRKKRETLGWWWWWGGDRAIAEHPLCQRIKHQAWQHRKKKKKTLSATTWKEGLHWSPKALINKVYIPACECSWDREWARVPVSFVSVRSLRLPDVSLSVLVLHTLSCRHPLIHSTSSMSRAQPFLSLSSLYRNTHSNSQRGSRGGGVKKTQHNTVWS